ncbi:MAG: UPF0182 family protein [Propionibacteriaceae bacterium]|jgi:uncharacterized membrane protein (UPF0182 family)|nr:UPF0182 family protein [Propionibacteriaceae bacterium]
MRAVLPTVIIIAVVIYLFTVFARLWTDHLWFGSEGFHQVFTTQLITQVVLFLVAFLVMGLAVAINAWLTLRGQPVDDAKPVYQDLLDMVTTGWRRWVAILGPALVFAIFAGISSISSVRTVLAWLNRQPFGQVDDYFGMDVSFYIFEYPWYRSLTSFFLTMTVICTLVVVVGYFLKGALFASVGSKRQTSRRASIHIGILLGFITLGYGVSKLLDRYGLLLNSQALLDGMTYTSANVRLTANLVLAVIAGITALLFFATAIGRGWRIPIISTALILVSTLVIGMGYPGFVQTFQVNPTEPDYERDYMMAHIQATRAAYGIGDVQIQDYSAVTTAAAGQLRSDAEALPGIRLIDPDLVKDTFEQLQQVRGYYSLAPVLDVDRYVIDGKQTDVVLAAREMNHAGLPAGVQNWNNLHTVYTHGYGLVAAYGNKRQASGEPEWLSRDIPSVGPLKADEPRIYHGEKTDNFIIVGRPVGQDPIEFDTPGGGDQIGEQYNTYTGSGGVPIGGFGNRLLYATRFTTINLLLSDRVNAESKILYDRNPVQRIQLVAPWLRTDSDPYPAVVNGRIVWIVDGYTTSVNYPNAQRVVFEDATSRSMNNPSDSPYMATSQINYIRNSVKAVVDAYDGTVTLYAWDEADPILQTWMKVFPETVRPKAEISDDLMSHLRYPEDLFKIQRQMITRYHMLTPESWYSQSDLWRIPGYPVKDRNDGTKEPTYFLSIKWPETRVDGQVVDGDPKPLFSQTTVYTPNQRENLAAYMSVVAEATSPQYGQIRILRMSDTQQIDGPGQAYNAMMANEEVSQTLLPFSSNQAAARAEKGNLLTIPLGGGLLYVEPIYTRQTNADATYPILRFVVVRFGTHVAISTTLQGALDKVFSGDAGATTGENDEGQTPIDPDDPNPPETQTKDQIVQAALAEAQRQFEIAQAALEAGNLGGYQAAIQLARAAVQRAIEAMNQ